MKKRNSYVYRLTITCLIFTMIPIFIFWSIYFFFYGRMLDKNLQMEFATSTKMTANQIGELYSNMSFVSLELLNRENFFSNIKRIYYNEENGNSITDNYNELVDSMNSYAYFQKSFNIIYLDAHGYYYNTDYFLNNQRKVRKLSEEEMDEMTWMERVNEADGNVVLMRLEGRIFSEASQSLFLARAISAPTKKIGYIIVQKKMDDHKYMFDILEQKKALYGLYTENGELLYSSENLKHDIETSLWKDGSGHKFYNLNGRKYMVSEDHDAKLKICMIAAFPRLLFWNEFMRSLFPTMLLSVLLVILIALGIVIFSRRFSRHLLRLTQLIKDTTIDNLVQTDKRDFDNAVDEIQYLSKEYFNMKSRMDSMIREKMELLTAQAEQRYQFLQYQINPHFLYNTLNLIGIMGVETGNREVYETCQMLAKLLRYSLQDYKKGISFKEEIDIINTYLNIMKIRFEHKIIFHVEYDERLNMYKIPRFTLQPFVENIFEHGYNSEHKKIILNLNIQLEEDSWRIEIKDNGRGIEGEVIKSINQFINAYRKNKGSFDVLDEGIGIKNTIIRLDTFFDGNFNFVIDNNGGEGCTIVLTGGLVR